MHVLLHASFGRELARLRVDEILERATGGRRTGSRRRTRRPLPRRHPD